MCIVNTVRQTDRHTDLLSLTCVSATSMRFQSRNIPEQDTSDRKCCFSLCYFIDLWLFPEGNKTGNARNTGAFAYGLYLLTTRYHFTRRQSFNSNTYRSLQVKCPIFFSDFNQMWIFWTDFHNSPQEQISHKFMWKPRYYKRMYGQTSRSQ